MLAGLLSVLAGEASAQAAKDLEFRRVDTGFNTNACARDRDGFLWLGTTRGLVKYDGYAFRRFASGPTSVSGSFVTAVFPDSQGWIWAGSPAGVSAYHKATDSFSHYRPDPADPGAIASDFVSYGKQNAFAEDRRGRIWIGSPAGLERFDKETGKFAHFEEGLTDPEVWSLFVDRAGLLWAGTSHGLHLVDPDSGKVLKRYPAGKGSSQLRGTNFKAILEDDEGAIWIGSSDQGISRLNCSKETFRNYKHDPKVPTSLSHNRVHDLEFGPKGTLWVATTDGGLNLFDPLTETFSSVGHDPAQPLRGLAENDVESVMREPDGSMWVVCLGGNLYRHDPLPRRFRIHSSEIGSNRLHSGGYIGGLVEDARGSVWLATMIGLSRHTVTTNTWTHYFHDPKDPTSLPQNMTQSVIFDRAGRLWVSSESWIFEVDPSTGKVLQRHKATGWPASPILDRTQDTVIWYASFNAGLLKFDTQTGKIQFFDPARIPEINLVVDLLQREDGCIWLCVMGGGLTLFDPKLGKTVTHYEHDPKDTTTLDSNTVYQLYRDSVGRHWVGTEAGLSLFDPEAGTFEHLPSYPLSSVAQIAEDSRGGLWLAALYGGGLVQFEPSTRTAKSFTLRVGIPPRLASFGKPLKTKAGEMWFYGQSIVRFRPERVKATAKRPNRAPVFVTSLSQNGVPLDLGKAPELVHELRLEHSRNRFEFQVALLSYRDPTNNQYRYILEGLDSEWFEAGNNRQGRYSGLPDGTYLLRVMGANEEGTWSDRVAELRVVVISPWWRTTGFRVALGLLTFVLVIGGARGWALAARRRNQQLEKEVALRTAELQEASQAKSTFLATMSHEIRTPMNAILGFTELLEEEATGERERGQLAIISSSSRLLLDLINDILDLSKIEAGKTEIFPGPASLLGILDDLTNAFSQEVAKKNLEIRRELEPGLPGTVVIDGRRLRQVLFNLVGNAVKFTQEGTIRLAVTSEGHAEQGRVNLSLTVEDTGVGIPQAIQERVFQPFTQGGEDSRGGTGLGLPIAWGLVRAMGGELSLERSTSAGSVFRVLLPDVEIVQVSSGASSELQLARIRFDANEVLVVDDVEHNLELVRRQLETLGLSCVVVADREEALRKARERPPALVLVDLRLEGASGTEVVRAFKEEDGLEAIPFVAMTASVLPEAEDEALRAGCEGFLRKPLSRASLIQELCRHLPHTSTEAAPPAKDASSRADRSEAGPGPQAPPTEASDNQSIPIYVDPDLKELVPGYLERQRSNLERMQVALEREDLREVRDIAHTMAGTGANYGFGLLSVTCGRVEIAIHEHDTAEVRALLSNLSDYLKRVTLVFEADPGSEPGPSQAGTR